MARKSSCPPNPRRIPLTQKWVHPFDFCVTCRFIILALILTAFYIYLEFTGSFTLEFFGNLVGTILCIAVILALLFLVARSRKTLKEAR